MGKGHRPGLKIADHHTIISSSPCEIREQLRTAYENSEPDSAKRLSIFKSLHAHEKKHGCGAKWESKYNG
jgi:hypothetical protein